MTQTKGLELLRKPFEPHQISKLPKETRAQIDARKADKNLMVFNCPECGGHHHKNAVHLDYVGHAALTDRLLDCDIEWEWEPVAFNAEGLPAFDRVGGLWIKLTVNGVTRLGYGHAGDKSGGDAIKEIIGDALRNAAMRFGAALDLWHKGDLHVEDADAGGHSQTGAVSPPPSEQQNQAYPFPDGPATGITQLKNMCRGLWREIASCSDLGMFLGVIEDPENAAIIEQAGALENPTHRREVWEGDGKDNPGLSGFIEKTRADLEQKERDMQAISGGQYGKEAA